MLLRNSNKRKIARAVKLKDCILKRKAHHLMCFFNGSKKITRTTLAFIPLELSILK